MPTINEVRSGPVGGLTSKVLISRLSKNWYHSPRVDGQLRLRQNPYQLNRVRLTHAAYQGPIGVWYVTTPPTAPDESLSAQQQALSGAYSRLRGKIYSGSASLGVTFASARQSKEMIDKRVKTLKSDVSQLYRDALASKKKGRDVSGLVLEGFFGWVPLYSDIHSAATSVIQLADVSSSYRASSSRNWSYSASVRDTYQDNTTRQEGQVRCSYTCQATIRNPNLWLQERAGLLNYGAVAWDLVPWSFLVNAFTSTGSIVNSLTDYAGLSLSNVTYTVKHTTSHSFSAVGRPGRQFDGAKAEIGWVEISQSRSTNGTGIPRPPLVVRVPELNFSTAAIGLSLITQQFSRFRALFN